MKIVFSALIIWALLVIPAVAAQNNNVICTGDARLDQYEGDWVHPKIINALKHGKSWTQVRGLVGYIETAITIDRRSISTTLAWHEGTGDDHCIVVTKNGIRLKDEHNDHPTVEYVLPFRMQNTKSSRLKVSFQQLIFGNKCFSTIQNEKWCFTPVTLAINGKASTYTLDMDTSEMPGYGTPISLMMPRIIPSKEAFEFLIFESKIYGWDVYRESFVTRENYKRLDPPNQPWRKLVRIK